MTVNKLKSRLSTFKDVLESDKQFFMYPYLEVSKKSLVRNLQAKYKKLTKNDYKYTQFEEDIIRQGHSNLTKKNLYDYHLYLTCEFDLVTFHDDLVKDLNGTIVIMNDWTVQFLSLYVFQTTDEDLVVSFNTFIHRKKSDGTFKERKNAIK